MKKILLATTIFLSFGLQANIDVNPLVEQCKNKKCDISMYEDFVDFIKNLKKVKDIPKVKPIDCNEKNLI